MAEQEPTHLIVGRVVKVHGIRGEFVVDVHTDSPERRFVEGVELGLLRGRETRPSGSLVLVAARSHAGRLLVRAEGVDTRDAAEGLRGAALTVRADEVESPEDPEEFHDHQLEGLRVELLDGSVVGEVTGVLHTPGGELLQVREQGGDEALIPFVTEIVPEIDSGSGRVVVDPPEGLLGPE